jgi:class 3 adenylate cyclase
MPADAPAAPGRLLVVDDNKVNRLLLGRGLEGHGHQVAFAENGRQALDRLRAEPFDLVMLDVIMPVMDGYEVLAALTADPHLRHIPVIVTSSLDELDSVVRCIQLGAEDYLTKPLNPVLLHARIGATLEKKRLRDQLRELVRKFATSEVADELLATGFELGGHLVDATAMFSDIRSFTTLAEAQSPADTIELLNTYYTLMFDAIQGHGGIVNQIIGDGLMAIFGAPVVRPNRREQAVRAALEMVELVELFSQEQAALGKPTIRIGVGVASGPVIAGYTGTLQRATYTCVGDTVNLAARLEARTKEAGRPILIDAVTRAGLGDDLRVEALGPLPIKGKTQPVEVYAVLRGEG